MSKPDPILFDSPEQGLRRSIKSAAAVVGLAIVVSLAPAEWLFFRAALVGVAAAALLYLLRVAEELGAVEGYSRRETLERDTIRATLLEEFDAVLQEQAEEATGQIEGLRIELERVEAELREKEEELGDAKRLLDLRDPEKGTSKTLPRGFLGLEIGK